MRISLLTVFLFVIAVTVMGHRRNVTTSKVERIVRKVFIEESLEG